MISLLNRSLHTIPVLHSKSAIGVYVWLTLSDSPNRTVTYSEPYTLYPECSAACCLIPMSYIVYTCSMNLLQAPN